MSKSVSLSNLEEPPLFLLFLAAISMALNLCFPQLAVGAYEKNQVFAAESPEAQQNVLAIREELNKNKVEAQNQNQVPPADLPAAAPQPQPAPAAPVQKTKKVVNVKNTKTATAKTPRATAPASTAPTSTEGKTTRIVTLSAYSSTVDQCDGNPFITASGTHVHDGTIALNGYPFGTKVMFPAVFGNKVFTVEDRTAARFSGRADIWFPSRSAALKFGIKRGVQMVIL